MLQLSCKDEIVNNTTNQVIDENKYEVTQRLRFYNLIFVK